ncbi:hypothetical protein V8C86DRAFT_2588852, partial [Haematococcus lacustris]
MGNKASPPFSTLERSWHRIHVDLTISFVQVFNWLVTVLSRTSEGASAFFSGFGALPLPSLLALLVEGPHHRQKPSLLLSLGCQLPPQGVLGEPLVAQPLSQNAAASALVPLLLLVLLLLIAAAPAS